MHHAEGGMEWMLMGISVAASVIMIIVAWMMHRKPSFTPSNGIAKVLENKWYVDELYDTIIVKPIAVISDISDRFVEKMGIDGIVNGVGKIVKWGGDRMRLLQTGQVGFYIFVMVIGIIVLFSLSTFLIR